MTIDSISPLSTQQYAINATSTVVSNAPEVDVAEVPKVEATEKIYVNDKDDGRDASNEKEGPASKSTSEEIKKAVDNLNKKMMNENSEAIFGIHDKTNRVTIKIVDKKTKEVIKELPPEKTLDMLAKVWEMAGILVDEKR